MKRALRSTFAIFAFFAFGLIGAVDARAFESGERIFAPSADLWERWTKHDGGSTATISHDRLTIVLQHHIIDSHDGVNRVDYVGLNQFGRVDLERYLEEMGAIAISTYNRDEQLAYWVNLYNALTLKVVLDHYPVDSIQDIDISPGVFASGPWGKKLFTVEGEELSLNDIEHRILRPIWKDARVHYAVNCASIGCPNLRWEAYKAETMDEALTEAAVAYVNDPRGVTVKRNKITVSRIYDWFIEDFGGSEKSVLEHLKLYADPSLVTRLDRIGKITNTQYDWSLNAGRDVVRYDWQSGGASQ